MMKTIKKLKRKVVLNSGKAMDFSGLNYLGCLKMKVKVNPKRLHSEQSRRLHQKRLDQKLTVARMNLSLNLRDQTFMECNMCTVPCPPCNSSEVARRV